MYWFRNLARNGSHRSYCSSCRQSVFKPHYAGGLLQLLNTACNMGPLSNGTSLWLGIEPADIFLYVFLPPLLLDSTVRTDYFTFKKVSSPIVSSHSWSVYSRYCSATSQSVFYLGHLYLPFQLCSWLASCNKSVYYTNFLPQKLRSLISCSCGLRLIELSSCVFDVCCGVLLS